MFRPPRMDASRRGQRTGSRDRARIAIAHKTGSITRIQHDAGIVYAARPYTLVILVRGIDDQKKSTALIAQLSKIVYKSIR